MRERIGPEADPESQYGYWAQLRLKGTSFRNCGVFGERTDEIAARLDEMREGRQVPDRAGRDQRHRPGQAGGGGGRNLRGMVEEGRRRKLRVALAEVLPWNNGYPRAARPIDALNRADREDRARARRARLPLVLDAGGPGEARPDEGGVDDRRRPPVGHGLPAAGADGEASRARANTASIIGSVSLPGERVLLAGVEAAEQQRAVLHLVLGPVAELRLGRTPSSRQRAVPRVAAEADDHRAVASGRAPRARTAGSCRARRAAACSRAARSAPRRPRTRRSAAGRRPPARIAGWFAKPVRCIERTASRPSGRR